ncbi:MAG: hypothetical protein JWO91_1698 [Acidobacteriaceae bacterium]|nr:hypothetical protein [Acidobacteriaceae bacterium]
MVQHQSDYFAVSFGFLMHSNATMLHRHEDIGMGHELLLDCDSSAHRA